MTIRFLTALCLVTLFAAGCNPKSEEPPLFTKLSSGQTGISFTNTITSSDTLNIHNYPFMFNGGGVAIGDINNDGLSDIFFTGNMVSSRLYLNKGGMRFEDITEAAGVQTDTWTSGVSLIDINADGYLDIYVSVVSREHSEREDRANLLFINNGDTTFTEKAAEYHIDDTGFTTHAAFLDYDRDGDLDLYLLNHSPGSFARNEGIRKPTMLFGQTSTSYDELYRNNGDGSFIKVTRQAGLSRKEGFGLGVAVSDINRDGWPDIYVSNDILPDDVLYINNKDGTFSDMTDRYLKHTSFAGMGVDIADFNNDGWPDILQVDMMPEEYRERKLMSGGISYEHYTKMRQKGFYYQYSFNTLQLSNGRDKNGDIVFSEIARLAGVAFTNWSWSALFGDYDNDGFKDIMITNGFPKAINNYDYLVAMNKSGQFGTRAIKERRKLNILDTLRSIKTPNYIFRNEGGLTFADKSEAWNFNEASFSFGASQADLDNDGDQDIVISNINAPALIYQNEADSLSGNHYISLKLKGPELNTGGIGAQIILKGDSTDQYQYHSPYRGYQSSTDNRLFFGLGKNDRIDTLAVFWPDGRSQLLTDVEADQQLTLYYEDSEQTGLPSLPVHTGEEPFTEATSEFGTVFKHQENEYNDYSIQGLLPYQLSRLGPPLASGDVNGDGLDDFYIGGAAGQSGRLFLQTQRGTFEQSASQTWTSDSDYEDVGAAFFDAEGDGDLDLYVTSGGYEFSPASELLQDRLYINAGSGTFIKNESALPRMLTSSSCVKPADYDRDGDPDLFVCGRMVPRRYPFPAKSYLLRNDGGSFTNVTSKIAPELTEPGMITDAEWSDFNGDGQVDLVTTGEWQPVRFYRNTNGSFENITGSLGLASQTGWWFSIEKGDFDHDGDVDFVAGNLGLNYSYRASEEEKFEVFASDFDGNQSLDLLFAIEKEGTHYPYYGKAKMGANIPAINKLFLTYESFANANVEDIIGEGGMNNALHLQVNTFASIYIENKGDAEFSITPLPNHAQISSINDIIAVDVDKDGNLDLVVAGNLYSSEPQTPRNDAGNGLVLRGNGKGDFRPVSPFQSGFVTSGDVKDLELIKTVQGEAILVANNDDSLQAFRINRK